MLVGFGDGSDHAAGIAHGYGVVGDVVHHYGATANDYVGADGDTGHHLHTATYPYIVAHGDGVGILEALVAALGVDGVAGSVEAAVGGYEDVVAKGDLGGIEDDGVVVGKEVFAYLDVIAVVAPEGGKDAEGLFAAAQQALHEGTLTGFIGGTQVVVVVAELLGLLTLSYELLVVVGVVHELTQHLVFFGHDGFMRFDLSVIGYGLLVL